jgi:hypothetical protein
MDSLSDRAQPARWILAGLLLGGAFFAAQNTALAQNAGSGQGQPTATEAKARDKAQPKSGTGQPNPSPTRNQTQAVAPANAQQPRRERTEAFRQSMQQTLEKRRQRRARRALGQDADDTRPVGAIVPWPMPPALIIRHTPEVHGEVNSLLRQLRR